MKISLVVAMSRNRVIGKDNALPWHLTEDLKFFKRVTMGKPIVMGRTTYESIGKPLPGRTNIVVSRNPDYPCEGIRLVGSVEASLELGKLIATQDGQDEVAVIGGAQIFEEVMDVADRIYLTEVHAHVEGDTWFPEFDRSEWQETAREDFPASGDNAYAFSILTLDRRKRAE